MILRALASLVLIALIGLNFLLPSQPVTARGPENRVRNDVETALAIGSALPRLELRDLAREPDVLDPSASQEDRGIGHRWRAGAVDESCSDQCGVRFGGGSEQRVDHFSLLSCGSSASRSPSPKMFRERTVTMMRTPG